MSIGPVLLMFINSFKLDVDIISGATGPDLFLPTIQNYETALCDVLWYEPEHLDFCALKFGGAFVNSLIIALVSTALTLVIGCMAAYALVRFKFHGARYGFADHADGPDGAARRCFWYRSSAFGTTSSVIDKADPRGRLDPRHLWRPRVMSASQGRIRGSS